METSEMCENDLGMLVQCFSGSRCLCVSAVGLKMNRV